MFLGSFIAHIFPLTSICYLAIICSFHIISVCLKHLNIKLELAGCVCRSSWSFCGPRRGQVNSPNSCWLRGMCEDVKHFPANPSNSNNRPFTCGGNLTRQRKTIQFQPRKQKKFIFIYKFRPRESSLIEELGDFKHDAIKPRNFLLTLSVSLSLSAGFTKCSCQEFYPASHGVFYYLELLDLSFDVGKLKWQIVRQAILWRLLHPEDICPRMSSYGVAKLSQVSWDSSLKSKDVTNKTC